eukprot:3907770-Prymnesium_polylepis.1
MSTAVECGAIRCAAASMRWLGLIADLMGVCVVLGRALDTLSPDSCSRRPKARHPTSRGANVAYSYMAADSAPPHG